ncbi:hypothetical protein [Streptomyces mexicanus]|jgi:hypothetical protein|uniref:hypothetical protein n=1 Tax=Streptomyces mexicanus TaxID=178566 RepID=UPI00368055FE
MTTRPTTRRLVTWIAPPLGGGALALTATSYAGAPGWTVMLGAVTGAVISVLPALLPQESEHRRDVWRDWLRHRERMTRLRLTAADPASTPQICEMITTNRPTDRASPASVPGTTAQRGASYAIRCAGAAGGHAGGSRPEERPRPRR